LWRRSCLRRGWASLLPVVIDGLLAASAGVVRIASGFPKCAPLAQKIPALVEGDLQFGKSPTLSAG